MYFTFGARYEIIAIANVPEVSKVKSSRGERKARLMKAAEGMIDELLDWSEATPESNLTQIEAVVGRLRKALGERMALEVIDAREARQPVPGPWCSKCQQEMRYKGHNEVAAESWVGDLGIERGYHSHVAHLGGAELSGQLVWAQAQPHCTAPIARIFVTQSCRAVGFLYAYLLRARRQEGFGFNAQPQMNLHTGPGWPNTHHTPGQP